MENCLFTGVCTALVTPFCEEKVNYEMLEKLIKRQIDAGIRSILLAGTTGESPTLSDREKIKMFMIGKKIAGDSCQIIAGTGSNDTRHAVTLSQAAEAAGADALLVVSPYYNKASPDGIYMHYWTIAQSVHIPVILYNVPSRTGLDIPVSVYARLAKLSNIAGVKEASTNIKKITEILSACGPDFSVWSGNDDLTVPVIALGGKGVISVASNIVPARMSSLCSSALAGNMTQASCIQRELLSLNKLLFCEVNPIPVKAAMKEIGFDCGNCRLPLTCLTQEHSRQMKEFFA